MERIFFQFQTYVECYFGTKIIVVQSDWGGKFRRLSKYFKQMGIQQGKLICIHMNKWVQLKEDISI